VHRLPDGAAKRFTNDTAGHTALLDWLAQTRVARIVYEPTGAYHRALEQALAAKGLPLAKVNPRQARRFAEATGKLAKTDRADAAMLARMGLALAPDTRPLPSQILRDLKELHLARQALMKDWTAAKNREKSLRLPLLKRQNQKRQRQIETQIAAVEAEIASRIAANAELAERLAILDSIPGIAKITACALLIEMPELGTLDGKQAASLAGLACARRFTCPHLWRPAATRSSRPNTTSSSPPESLPRSLSSPSCESSSSSQTRSCASDAIGPKILLDQDGYSNLLNLDHCHEFWLIQPKLIVIQCIRRKHAATKVGLEPISDHSAAQSEREKQRF
jgi:transposase